MVEELECLQQIQKQEMRLFAVLMLTFTEATSISVTRLPAWTSDHQETPPTLVIWVKRLSQQPNNHMLIQNSINAMLLKGQFSLITQTNKITYSKNTITVSDLLTRFINKTEGTREHWTDRDVLGKYMNIFQ